MSLIEQRWMVIIALLALGLSYSIPLIEQQWMASITMGSLKMAQDVCKHITSKRIELESPGCSGFKDH